MKIFIDTNILISSALWPGSIPAKALDKASFPNNMCMTCEYNIHEMIDVCHRKFRGRLSLMYDFLSEVMAVLWVVPMPEDEDISERLIRDVKDRPVLRAAINAGADILLTGDKDFLEADVKVPRIMSASEFLGLKQAAKYD